MVFCFGRDCSRLILIVCSSLCRIPPQLQYYIREIIPQKSSIVIEIESIPAVSRLPLRIERRRPEEFTAQQRPQLQPQHQHQLQDRQQRRQQRQEIHIRSRDKGDLFKY